MDYISATHMINEPENYDSPYLFRKRGINNDLLQIIWRKTECITCGFDLPCVNYVICMELVCTICYLWQFWFKF